MSTYSRRLEAADLSTDYHLAAGLLQGPEPCWPERIVVVTDENVHRHHRQLFDTEWIVLPAGEQTKCLEQARALYDRLAELGVDRATGLVALGGGVVGDLAGFAAATYLRGLPFYQLPTTLLAMVDSSIGGKVGVDLPQGKNLVGAFYAPRAIYADTSLLASLPGQEWSGGMAEVIKHALLDSEEHLRVLEELPSEPAAWGAERTASVVYRSACVKMELVEQDPREKGRRAELNLGHTLGHALESAAGYSGLSHGQAVAIGMVAACRLSRRLGLLEHDLEPRLAALLERWGLPIACPLKLAWERVLAALSRDKKNRGGRLTFVLPHRPGRVSVVPGVDPRLVRAVFDELSPA